MRTIPDRMRRYGFVLLVFLLGILALNIPVVRDGAQTPILVFFFIILLSAWYGGMGPGLLATSLIVLMTWPGSFPLWRVVRLALFLAGGVGISYLAETLHSARRRAEEGQLHLTAVLKSIGDAVITTDAQGRITFVNPVAEFLTGWMLESARGRPLSEVFRVIEGKAGPEPRALPGKTDNRPTDSAASRLPRR